MKKFFICAEALALAVMLAACSKGKNTEPVIVTVGPVTNESTSLKESEETKKETQKEEAPEEIENDIKSDEEIKEEETIHDNDWFINEFLDRKANAFLSDNTEKSADDYKIGQTGEDAYVFKEQGDYDNDGEDEYFYSNQSCGGVIFDVRNEKVYVLTEGKGSTDYLGYAVEFENAVWIVKYDVCTPGFQTYRLTKYNSEGNVVASKSLVADYRESGNIENDGTVYKWCDQIITKEEYIGYIGQISKK